MSEQSEKDVNVSYKIFCDSVHGHIKMHPLLVRIIDTPEFQRLRNIKQLAGAYFVFPGASHNRFEHSIGVAHLAGKLLQSLKDNQKELKITEKDKLCVQIAGLCHDLGHGLYSHLYDVFLHELSKNMVSEALTEWKHEAQSITMFDQLIKNNVIVSSDAGGMCTLKQLMESGHFGHYFSEIDFQFIRELIYGPHPPTASEQGGREEEHSEWPYKGRPKDQSFLYEIVANHRTGIDVDKMDYFSRDCHHLGMKSNFSHERYVMFARVCNDEETKTLQICMRDKEAINMYEFFQIRYLLHNNVYQHRVIKAVEMMIVDVLLEAEDHFRICGKKLSEATQDPGTFLRLTDDILQEIMRSTNPGLHKAQEMIRRIEKRDCYKFVDAQKFAPKDLESFDDDKWEKVIKRWLQCVQQSDEEPFSHKNFIIKPVKLNYGMKDKNPIDCLRFYRKNDLNTAIKLKKEQVSRLLPDNFSETNVMLFYRNPGGDFQDLLKNDSIKKFWDEVKKRVDEGAPPSKQAKR